MTTEEFKDCVRRYAESHMKNWKKSSLVILGDDGTTLDLLVSPTANGDTNDLVNRQNPPTSVQQKV